jgi:CubicO group peptidase (beta-lactamase class C family)
MSFGEVAPLASGGVFRSDRTPLSSRYSPEVRLDSFLESRKSAERETFSESRTLATLLHLLRNDKPLPEPLREISKPALSSILQLRLFGPTDSVLEARLDRYMKPMVEIGGFHGTIFFAKKGVACVRKAYGKADVTRGVDNTTTTRFQIASLTKAFTATAIMVLQEGTSSFPAEHADPTQQRLSVEDTIDKWLPGYPRGDEITIAQLMRHTSGVHNATGSSDWDDTVESSLDAVIDQFKDRPMEFEPGEQHKYNNFGYILLTKIIEVASGQKYGGFLQESVLGPLGMHNTDVVSYEETDLAVGHVVPDEEVEPSPTRAHMSCVQGGGCLGSTIEDMFLWDRELQRIYADPTYSGILSQESLAAMFEAGKEPDFRSGDPSSYGFGWHHFDEPKKMIAHTGRIPGFESEFSRFIDDDTTILFLMNSEPYENVMPNLVDIVYDRPTSLPRIPFESREPMTDALRAKHESYVGIYEFQRPDDGPAVKHEITMTDDKLYISINDSPPVRIRPESETRFFRKMYGWSFSFAVEPDGTVKGLTIKSPWQDTLVEARRV